jgi:hypothetical protein
MSDADFKNLTSLLLLGCKTFTNIINLYYLLDKMCATIHNIAATKHKHVLRQNLHHKGFDPIPQHPMQANL